MTEAAVDRVLTAAPPTFTEEEAVALARELFGVEGMAVSVASERDQTFLIDGDRAAVLKISNAASSYSEKGSCGSSEGRLAGLLPVRRLMGRPAARIRRRLRETSGNRG